MKVDWKEIKMRILALALVFVAAVSYCKAATVEELIKIADEAGAPFTPRALERMDNKELWGAKRANSSVDVVIINTSEKYFKPVSHRCPYGSLSNGLLAESNLRGQTSTVLGVQSAEDTDALSCILFYMDAGYKSFFRILLDNTLRNQHNVYCTFSEDLKIKAVGDQGKNSQVRVVVSDVSSSGTLAPVLQRELKGSRNKFVKVSKNGSSVRSI